ncbi:Pentapeptide repeat-containing protein [Abditibacterium utsteinense]|uniref:Pentapeptide repeat-containing protein n=1 Tax=Abditibacterium utsteinense TaxID=1960156 RepID=A0A2S8SU13_9BACT|nr:pentapeptide repeat-containing protein [Abditibacterium utsteinense]PQV64292.1 Pentapeptide repeat-containing protein [Abditibacterium utsteinense]
MPDSRPPTPTFGKPLWILLLGAAIFLILLVAVPRAMTANLQTSPLARLTLETQIRDSAAKLVLAAVTFLAATLVWRYLQNLGKVVENSVQTLAAAERTAFFAAQAAETERYARAMALLGDEKVEVRLGGIYTLERLARESSRDHGPIMEVLAAYTREHARWSEGESAPARVRADLQAILSVIGRRHAPFDPSEGHIDLHATSLARAYLPYANLEGAFLYETNLDGAILQGANLRGATLWKASLVGATLQGAHLEGADLTAVAGLTKEQLQGAHFDDATKLPDTLRGETSHAVEEAQKVKMSEEETQDLKLPTRRT